MNRNARSTGEAFCNGIVRRMVSLPRTLLGGFSRVINNHTRNQHMPSSFPLPYPPQPIIVQDEWAFLTNFEGQFGTLHPFFYACRFVEALRIAEQEHKFMFIYLHSPDHPFTPSFCRETLCSEVVVQFLDTNFVCWGGLANMGEGLFMANSFQPPSFPFCAVVAPAPGDNLAVLQQIEGPVSPAELVEILQKIKEEQGLAFGSARAEEEQKRRSNQRLKEEQDAAYFAALHIDQEKDRLKHSHSQERVHKQVDNQKHKQNSLKNQTSKVKEATTSRETRAIDTLSKGNGAQATKILIRFPNGERREHSFVSTDKVQAIYRYIDSLELPGIGMYRLISSFPRKVYGVDQMGMTLKEAGLHPQSSVLLEVL